MMPVLSFRLAFLGCPIASAFILNLTSPTRLQQVANTIPTLIPSNEQQSDNRVTNLTFNAHCNGPASGIGLTEASCQDAVSKGIPYVTDSRIHNYGDRSLGNYDINLPQRYISGDGSCVVDITLRDIHKGAYYYPFGLAIAAMLPVAKCVQEHPSQGGTVENFDQSRNMRAVVHSYKPKVMCVGHTASPDIRASCQGLLDTMLIYWTRITFGYDAGVRVRTPYRRVSADGICVMEIDTNGVRSDFASWRDFWEVGVALNGMCIRNGREGFQTNIGSKGGLHMELKDNRNRGAILSSS